MRRQDSKSKSAKQTSKKRAPKQQPAPDRDTRSDYQRRADHYAAVLSHPDTPESFRMTFEVIYNDLLIDKTDWQHPRMIRKTYAAMREYLDDNNYCGDGRAIDEVLLILIETQLPEHVREAARLVGMKGGARNEN
jgi:hypothetical protein